MRKLKTVSKVYRYEGNSIYGYYESLVLVDEDKKTVAYVEGRSSDWYAMPKNIAIEDYQLKRKKELFKKLNNFKNEGYTEIKPTEIIKL